MVGVWGGRPFSTNTKNPKTYGRLDVLVYNSGAIYWAPVDRTPLRRFQLMQRINPEGLYATVQAALPHLRAVGGRVVVVSPPIYSRFFRGKTAYAMGKVAMSVLTKGLAMDFRREESLKDMAITSIWPAVVRWPPSCRSTQDFALCSSYLAHASRPLNRPPLASSPNATPPSRQISASPPSFPMPSSPSSDHPPRWSTVSSSWTRTSCGTTMVSPTSRNIALSRGHPLAGSCPISSPI